MYKNDNKQLLGNDHTVSLLPICCKISCIHQRIAIAHTFAAFNVKLNLEVHDIFWDLSNAFNGNLQVLQQRSPNLM